MSGGIDVSDDESDGILATNAERDGESEDKDKSDGEGPGNDEGDGGNVVIPEPTPPPRKRRVRAKKEAAMKATDETAASDESNGSNGKRLTIEEFEASLTAVPNLPKATDNVRTLGDLMSEYEIGQKPEFKLHVYRLYPKLFPGNRKADGYYVELESPIDEKWLAEEYGGGVYRVSVMGPHPKGNGTKQYATVQVNIGGAPREDRLPRSQILGEGMIAPVVAPPPFMPPPENPRLAEKALQMFGDVAERERDERRRVEDKSAAQVASAQTMLNPIIDAEKRHAENIVRLEREKAAEQLKAAEERREAESRRFVEKLTEMEERHAEDRAATLESLRKVQDMNDARPSFGSELEKILPLIQKKDDGGGARLAESTGEMANKLLDNANKQSAAQIDAMRSSYEAQMASMRTAQDQAMQSLRDAGQREMTAEREAWRHREQRFEDMLKAEREERRRDQDRLREQQEDRDRTWKDRLESQEINLKTQWESRLALADANHRERVEWMQREMDRRDKENNELRAAQNEKGDVFAQVHRAKELQDAVKATWGGGGMGDSAPSAPATAPSIFAGMDVGDVVETIAEKGPEWIAAIRGGGPKPPPQYHPGQVVPTAQGPMVVIPTPEGLRLTPQAAYQQAQAARANTPLLPQGGGKKPGAAPQTRPPQRAPQAAQRAQRPKRDDDNFEPVPNLADGLPAMQAPWERKNTAQQVVAGTTGAPQQEQPPMPVQSFAMPHPAAAAVAAPVEEIAMSGMEKKIAAKLAELVSESLSSGDEASEFVSRLLAAGHPDMVVHGLAAKSDREIILAIAQVAPGTAGTTPGGQQFIAECMATLRATLAGASAN